MSINFQKALACLATVALLLLLGAWLSAAWERPKAAPELPTPTQVVERYWKLKEGGQAAEANEYWTDSAAGVNRREGIRELFSEVVGTMKLRVIKVERESIEGDSATVTAEAMSEHFGRRVTLKHDLYKSNGEWRIVLIDWAWQDGPAG